MLELFPFPSLTQLARSPMGKNGEYPNDRGRRGDRTMPNETENFPLLMLTTPDLTPVRLNLAKIVDIIKILWRILLTFSHLLRYPRLT